MKFLNEMLIKEIFKDDFSFTFSVEMFDGSLEDIIVLSPVIYNTHSILLEYADLLCGIPCIVRTSYENDIIFFKAEELYKVLSQHMSDDVTIKLKINSEQNFGLASNLINNKEIDCILEKDNEIYYFHIS